MHTFVKFSQVCVILRFSALILISKAFLEVLISKAFKVEYKFLCKAHFRICFACKLKTFEVTSRCNTVNENVHTVSFDTFFQFLRNILNSMGKQFYRRKCSINRLLKLQKK